MTKLELILGALLACSLLSGSVATAQSPCDSGSVYKYTYETPSPAPKDPVEAPQWVPGNGRNIPDQTCQKVGGTIMCY